MSGAATGRDALVASAIRWGAFFAVALAATIATAAPVWRTGKYSPAAWRPVSNNLLSGAESSADGSKLTTGTENGKNLSRSIDTLTDGEVPGATIDYAKVVQIKSGTAAWTFPKADIGQIRVFTRWGDGGRDGVNISSVEVRYDGSEEWTDIGVSSVSYGNGNDSSGSSLYAILQDPTGAALAVGVTGLRLSFNNRQDNGASGYAEIEATTDRPVWRTGTYSPAAWRPVSGNLLSGATADASGLTRYDEVNSSRSITTLTDGEVPGSTYDISKVFGIKSGTAAWTFPKADIGQIRVFTRWKDGGRDGVNVSSVEVRYDGSEEWTDIGVSSVSYGNGNDSSGSSLYAILQDPTGAALAVGVTGLRLSFNNGQDNKGSGYAEIEAQPTIYYKSGVFAEGSADLKVVTRDGEGNETEIELQSGDNVVFDDAVAGANAVVRFGETLPSGVTYSFGDNWTGTFVLEWIAGMHVWTGANGDNNMNTAGNWSGNAVPSTGAAVYIPTAETATIVNDIVNFSPSSITFGPGAGQVIIGGNAITGVAAITNLSSAVQTFNASVSGGAIDIYNTSKHCAFRGGITLGSATFGGAETEDARALVGAWKFTGGDAYAWTPVENNRVMDNSSVTVEGELFNSSNLVIDAGCVVTAATLKATGSIAYITKTNHGRLVVTGECRMDNTTKDCYLAAPANDSVENDATVEFGSYYGKSVNSWTRINAKTVIVGAGGITSAYRVHFVGRPVLYSRTGSFSINSESNGAYSGTTDGVEINTTQYGTENVPATITLNAQYIQQNTSSSRGAMKVTGCGTVLINSVSTFSGGLTVSDTATVAVNKDKQPGAGTVTVNSDATLQVAQSGTVALGGGLTLADGAALGFNFTDSQTAPVLDVTGKTMTLNGNKNITVKVSSADGIRPRGGSYVLTSGGKFAGANVTLASGAPDWVKNVSVVDGDIVLEAKPIGFKLIVK